MKEKIRQEIQKIREMDPEKRWSYFKTYYLTQTVIGILVFTAWIWFLFDFRESSKEIILSGCMINVNMNTAGYAYFTEEFASDQGKDPEESVVQISMENNLQFMDAEQAMDNVNYEMALIAQVAAGDYDYMIMDESAWRHFQKDDIYADLGEFLSDEEQKALEQRLVLMEDPENRDVVFPAALCLTDTKLYEICDFDAEEVYLTLINVNQENGNGEKLLDYVIKTIE